MHVILHYGEEGDPNDTRYTRVFPSREAALARALVLYRYGYSLYAMRDRNGEQLTGEQILERARLLPAAP